MILVRGNHDAYRGQSAYTGDHWVELPGVAVLSETLEEIAFFEYEGSQDFGALKGVDSNFARVNGIDSTIREGEYRLREEDRNCVVIGAMGTPMIEERMAKDPERAKRILEKYIIRRMGKPTDVANMVVFLTSSASDYITGQVYPVNGGFTFAL